jgi:hypothetical protein
MNLLAAVKGIAPAGGIRPASHITASFVSATKAKPAAHYFAAVIEGRLDISGRSDLSRSSTLAGRKSDAKDSRADAMMLCVATQHLARKKVPKDIQPNILSGQRSNTDERHIGRQRFGLSPRTVGATSRSGGCRTGLRVMRNSGCRFVQRLFLGLRPRNLGNPCAEKVSAHRSRQLLFV